MTAKRVIMLILLTTLGGCSRGPESEPSPSDLRPEVFEPVHRVATELRAAQEVGMDRRRFGELLEKFATEIALARDKLESPRQQQVFQGYTEVLQIYKDAAEIWDVKISIPELTYLADEAARVSTVTGSIDGIMQSTDFKMAAIDGIPLNVYPTGSTGIDDLVARYQLPVTDSNGWKTIPHDSVERVWSRARTKTEEVAKMLKG